MLKGTGLALGVSAVAAGTYVAVDDGRRLKASRSFAFWTRLAPIMAHYKWVQRRVRNDSEAEQDAAFEELHTKYAPRVLQLTLDLGSLYVKAGQVMSTRADMVPLIYREALTVLQDDVPPRPFADIERTLREDYYGRELGEIFLNIEEKPLGAASIGQVHGATLLDGRDVVLKVQYPEVHLTMESDFDTMILFAKLAQPSMEPLFVEMKKQFLSEMDFHREAWALEVIGDDIREHFPGVKVPYPVRDLATQRVCVMERVYGKKLIDTVLGAFEKMAEESGMSVDDLKARMKSGKSRPDMALIRGKIETYNRLAWLYNWTVGWVAAPMTYKTAPPDHSELLRQLVRIQGHCVLSSGMFNGDLHPGNVLLLDKDEMLCLIDFGSTKWISWSERRALAQLIIALATGTSEDVVRCMKNTGFRTKHMKDEFIELNARFFFDRDDESVRGDRSPQEFMEWIGEQDPTEELPGFLFLPMRTAMLLRAMGTILGAPGVSVAQEWLPVALQVVEDTAWVDKLALLQEAHNNDHAPKD